MSSLSDHMAVFSVAGPLASDSLALAKCTSCPSPGRYLEWDFEGEKVYLYFGVLGRCT